MCPRKRQEIEGEENLIEEIMTENFLNLGKKTNIKVHEAQRSQTRHTQIEILIVKENF